MTTIRTGTDLAAAEDVVAGITAHGDRYLDRLFTARERADSGDDPERLAARFAGKEAVVKLLRPAPGDAVPLRDVAIVLDERGLAVATAVALSDR